MLQRTLFAHTDRELVRNLRNEFFHVSFGSSWLGFVWRGLLDHGLQPGRLGPKRVNYLRDFQSFINKRLN